jgi:hypothetical protein
MKPSQHTHSKINSAGEVMHAPAFFKVLHAHPDHSLPDRSHVKSHPAPAHYLQYFYNLISGLPNPLSRPFHQGLRNQDYRKQLLSQHSPKPGLAELRGCNRCLAPESTSSQLYLQRHLIYCLQAHPFLLYRHFLPVRHSSLWESDHCRNLP